MLSYKNWKEINESLMGMGPITLGLSNPQNIAVVGSNTAGLEEEIEGELESTEDWLAEAKKKMKILKKKINKAKKKMNGDMEDEVPSDDGDGDDEDMGDDDGDDEDVDDDDDSDSGDDDGDSDSDDNGDDEDMGDGNGGGMFMKKGGKKKMGHGYMKKGGKKKSGSYSKKKMKKEAHWWASDPDPKNWDGISALDEDSLVPPTDPNADFDQQQEEPQPGDVGFAPDGRVGGIR